MAKKAAPKKTTPALAAKKAAAPPPAPEKKVVAKKHERKAKPTEQERLERGRRLVAGYLEQRDGMDPQTALDIVETMSGEDLMVLIEEANTGVIERTNAGAAVSPGSDTVPAANVVGAQMVGDDDDSGVAVDFLAVDGLVNDPDFPQLVMEAFDASKHKNEAEKEYKEKKAILFAKLTAAGIKVDSDKVTCLGVKLAPYKGKSVNLDKMKLIEAGVDIDLINKGYRTTEYDDVRMTVPKEAK